MSDVPGGGFTSGGLDSSLLVAAAARVMAGEKIHTYAVKFTEPGYDESLYAEAVTHSIRTIHHAVTADDRALERAFEHVARAPPHAPPPPPPAAPAPSRALARGSTLARPSPAEPVGAPAILPTSLLAE